MVIAATDLKLRPQETFTHVAKVVDIKPWLSDPNISTTCCDNWRCWLEFDDFQTWANGTEYRYTAQQGGKTRTTWSVQQCCDMLCWNVRSLSWSLTTMINNVFITPNFKYMTRLGFFLIRRKQEALTRGRGGGFVKAKMRDKSVDKPARLLRLGDEWVLKP